MCCEDAVSTVDKAALCQRVLESDRVSREVQKPFQRDLPTTTDWRWEVLAEVLKTLLPMQAPLQGAWHATRYQKGHVGGNDQDRQQEEHLSEADRKQLNDLDWDSLTRAIKSNMFWVYGKMLLAVHQICDTFGAWCEACSCHDRFTDEEQKYINVLVQYFHAKNGVHHADERRCNCRVDGRRAWEMASGAPDTVLKEAFEFMTSVMMTEICTLDEAEQEKSLADMENIKAQLS